MKKLIFAVTVLAVSTAQADTIFVDDNPACVAPDCCFPNDTPGCGDPECEAIVCVFFPLCCEFQWTLSCAFAAESHCALSCMPTMGSGTEADPYCRLQTAIDNALNGDEVIVAPGTYFETIDFLGKAIWLHSSDGPDVTVIDARQTGRVVRCASGEGTDTILEGFTITGGIGGMSNLNSSPSITNCVFRGNTNFGFCLHICVPGKGGGMYNDNSNPVVVDSLFEDNTVGGQTGASGGGMYNTSSDPMVVNCVFSGNSAIAGCGPGSQSRGGGMSNTFDSNPSVINCTFANNDSCQGGGMYNTGSGSVIGCTFTGNVAKGGGGMSNTGSPTVTNCTFSENTADNIGGGMLSSGLGSNPTVTNCTFSGNTADNNGGGMYNGSGSSTVTNCVLWNDSPDEFSGDGTPAVTNSNVQGGWPGTNNIDADPLFVDPDNGDYRLQPGSPCIDAGHNNAIADLADTDLDGDPRFADDPATTDTGCGVPVVVDMGAYEYQGDPATVVFGDINGDGIVRIMDLVALNQCMGSADPDCCVADLDLDGEVGTSDLMLLIQKLVHSVPFGP